MIADAGAPPATVEELGRRGIATRLVDAPDTAALAGEAIPASRRTTPW